MFAEPAWGHNTWRTLREPGLRKQRCEQRTERYNIVSTRNTEPNGNNVLSLRVTVNWGEDVNKTRSMSRRNGGGCSNEIPSVTSQVDSLSLLRFLRGTTASSEKTTSIWNYLWHPPAHLGKTVQALGALCEINMTQIHGLQTGDDAHSSGNQDRVQGSWPWRSGK